MVAAAAALVILFGQAAPAQEPPFTQDGVPPVHERETQDALPVGAPEMAAAPAVPRRLDLGAYSLYPDAPVAPPLAGPRFDTAIDVIADAPRDPNDAMAEWWRHWNFEYSIYGHGINIQNPMPGGGFNILPLIDWLAQKAGDHRRNRQRSALTADLARAAQAEGERPGAVRSVRVNGVDLHYADRGAGPPIVFVHGGLADYREGEPVAREMASGYRTILYSGRPGRSAAADAEDLAGLLRSLRLGPARVVGVSDGAGSALLLGLRHRDLVHSLVLVEPPVLERGGLAVGQPDLARLEVPVLVLTGQQADTATTVDAELARLLPKARRGVIAGASRDICRERPAACASVIGAFLAESAR